MQTYIVTMLGRTNGKKISTTILFVSFFITLCVYPLFDSKMEIDSSRTTSLQAVQYYGGKHDWWFIVFPKSIFTELFLLKNKQNEGNSRTLKSFNEQNTSVYNRFNVVGSVANEAEIANEYYRLRYDI
jgi:hypothetical protein